MQVFLHMQQAARTDKGCMPNVITYSALITAFVAGGRLDKAYEVFLSMRPNDVPPDHICYSTLIAGAALSPCSLGEACIHLHAIYTHACQFYCIPSREGHLHMQQL